jgi:Raf kinase inhibitor-like YbhB/YbcL family protein
VVSGIGRASFSAVLLGFVALVVAGCGSSSNSGSTSVDLVRAPAAGASKPVANAGKTTASATATPTPQQKETEKEAHTYHEELREKKEVEGEEKENAKKFAKHEAVTATPRRASSREVRSNGESYNTLAGMNLTSPAFEVNGQIPVVYTCEGKGISPPLRWARVPSEAKSLLLYVIDDTADSFTDPLGGVRWMVANIDPQSSTELKAGEVPAGAVVGKGNNGKTGYGPICAEKGKSDTIEFLIYAFKEKLDVNPGFSEQEVQGQYTANGNKMLSENATTYGVYTRPQ